MPQKGKRKSNSARTPKRRASTGTPKWRRLGFGSYRQYLNERYRALGFASYSDYTAQLKAGKVPSTGIKRRLKVKPLPPPTPAILRQVKLVSTQAPPIGLLERINYESRCPFVYGIDEPAGARIVSWLESVFSQIEQAHANVKRIYAGAWRIFGHVALDLKEDGSPTFEKGEWEEYSSTMDWEKCKRELLSIARAYGEHEFREFGRRLPRTTKYRIYFLLITRVKVTVIIEHPEAK